MRRLLFLAAILTVCAALWASAAPRAAAQAAASPAAAPPAAVPAAPEAAWTVLVYMGGDNSLEPWITRDLDNEMAAVGSNADVQVVALADRGRHPGAADGGWKGARVFHVTKGMKATAENAVADWGEANMGSPQTLVDFVTWARAAYPAQRYALIFWDHGWGWWPGNTMQDVTSNDYLDMDELRRALETVGGVDMAGMETCLGQTIEVQAEFRGFAKALAGLGGFHRVHDVLLPRDPGRAAGQPTMSASELAVVAAKSIRTGHDKWSLTGSAVALDWRWDRLAQAVSDLGWEPRQRHREVSRSAGGGAPGHGLAAAELPRGARPVRHGRRDQGARDVADDPPGVRPRDEVVAALHPVRVEPRGGRGDARHRHLLARGTAPQRGLLPMGRTSPTTRPSSTSRASPTGPTSSRLGADDVVARRPWRRLTAGP